MHLESRCTTFRYEYNLHIHVFEQAENSISFVRRSHYIGVRRHPHLGSEQAGVQEVQQRQTKQGFHTTDDNSEEVTLLSESRVL